MSLLTLWHGGNLMTRRPVWHWRSSTVRGWMNPDKKLGKHLLSRPRHNSNMMYLLTGTTRTVTHIAGLGNEASVTDMMSLSELAQLWDKSDARCLFQVTFPLWLERELFECHTINLLQTVRPAGKDTEHYFLVLVRCHCIIIFEEYILFFPHRVILGTFFTLPFNRNMQ